MVHSLYQSLNNLETIYADRIGIRYYDEAKGGVVEVPFRQYAADLRRFVAFLRSRTPNPLGQRVAILARNSYHYVMCMYGAVLAGAVAVPLNTGKNWDEIRYELDLVEPMCVLHDGGDRCRDAIDPRRFCWVGGSHSRELCRDWKKACKLGREMEYWV